MKPNDTRMALKRSDQYADGHWPKCNSHHESAAWTHSGWPQKVMAREMTRVANPWDDLRLHVRDVAVQMAVAFHQTSELFEADNGA